MKISGRFYLIQRTDENVVVACVGELNPFLLKEKSDLIDSIILS